MLFLYSPFTSETIELPEWKEDSMFQVAGFSLNATSPKCVICLLTMSFPDNKIHVSLCSPGDVSWRKFEFDSGIEPGEPNWAASAACANGVLYCVFVRGELGAFNVELEEWTVLGGTLPPKSFSIRTLNLVVIDTDVWVFDQLNFSLFRFDSPEKRWVYVKDLNSHALFLGPSSFAVQAVGETSELANTIVFHDPLYRSVKCYGIRTSCETGSSSLYRKCVEAANCVMTWIQLPSPAIWTADDLIHAV